VKTITSKDNPTLKAARKLHTRKGREEAGAFLAEGEKLIDEASAAEFEIECIFINANEESLEKLSFSYSAFPLILLEEKLFRELSQTENPQPCIAVVRRPKAEKKDAAPERILILDRIGDPGNAGTMIRTALAAGMDEAWCVSGTADVFSDKVIRASAGAVFNLPVKEKLKAADCIKMLREIGAKLIVCDAEGANIYNEELTGRLGIVIGSESAGSQKVFIENADAVVGIPMTKASESLNAAVAAGVVMYEVLRQSKGDAV